MIKKVVARVFQFLSWPLAFFFFNLFFIIKIQNKESLRRSTSPILIISNHISSYDSFVFRLALGIFSDKLPLRFMAVNKFDKSRILNLLSFFKIIDFVYVLFGVFVVEVGKGIDRNLIEAERIIHEKGNIVMYPEGSMYNDGKVGEFKTGAAVLVEKTGVSVLPIAMRLGKKKGWRREFFINIGEVFEVNKKDTKENITSQFYQKVFGLYNV